MTFATKDLDSAKTLNLKIQNLDLIPSKKFNSPIGTDFEFNHS